MNTSTHQGTRKLLIIEDEGDMCLLLNIMLNGKGFDLDHVKSVAAARDYIATETPALVILDNKLTDGFGVEFLPELKSTLPDTRVIMISGLGDTVKTAALAGGADVFLEKPFKRDKLYEEVLRLSAQEETPA